MLTPSDFRTWPLPTYPEIRLARAFPKTIGAAAAAARPEAVHIATEGPIGFAVRRWCVATGRPFTTSFHTRFPEYLSARAPIPERLTYAILRRFHNAGRACMVATESLRRELAARGFEHLVPWTRGVDSDLFRPREGAPALDLPRPIFLFVGRVAVEKNIGAFLALDLPGSKVVVGDGPALQAAQDGVSRSAFPRHPDGRDPRCHLRQRRRLRFSEPDRHVRHRAPRGAGSRRAGRGLSSAGPARRGRRDRGRCPRRGPPRRGTRRTRYSARQMPRLRAGPKLGGLRPPVPRQYRRRE